MTPRPIIVFDTVPRVRVSGAFKIGAVSYFNDRLGGLSGIVFSATDGTTTKTVTTNYNTLRTQFYDVGSLVNGTYTTYSGYINPNFFYSGFPIPAWAYEASFNTSDFLGLSPTITVTATAYPKNLTYSPRSITGAYIKDALVTKNTVWVDSVNGVDASGQLNNINAPYKGIGPAMGRVYQGGTAIDYLQVYLKSGNHDWIGNPAASFPYSIFESTSGWVDIQPAAGLSRSDVVIKTNNTWTPSSNTIHHIHLKNVTVSGIQLQAGTANNQNTKLWADNCLFKGGETFTSSVASVMPGAWNYQYHTNCYYTNVVDGCGWGNLTRDCLTENYIQAGWRVTPEMYPTTADTSEILLLNSQVYNQDALGTAAHPDVIHLDFTNPTGRKVINGAVCGARAYHISNSQGIFAGADSPLHQDIAFVNILIPSGNSRMGGGMDHLIMRNCSFPSGTWLWQPGQLYAGPQYQWHNTEFTSNIFHNMSVESGTETSFRDAYNNTWTGNLFSHNAFQNPGIWTGLGEHSRTGTIEYNDISVGDFRAFPMFNNPIFAIGYQPTGWNTIGSEVIYHLEPEQIVWGYAGAFSPIYPDLGAWMQTANDPRSGSESLSADCIISPGGCQRVRSGGPIRGGSSTRMFINVLRPTSTTLHEYEEMLYAFINQLLAAIATNHR